jgi:hypothetical protein
MPTPNLTPTTSFATLDPTKTGPWEPCSDTPIDNPV